MKEGIKKMKEKKSRQKVLENTRSKKRNNTNSISNNDGVTL